MLFRSLEAYYIAQALYNYILIISPEIIILGGGIMQQEKLFGLIRKEIERLNGSYLLTRELKSLDTYIVPAALGGDQGIAGAIKLALAKVNQNIDLDCYNNVWVIGEQVNGEIHPVTVELLGEGKKLANSIQKDLYVVLAGCNLNSSIEKLQHIEDRKSVV